MNKIFLYVAASIFLAGLSGSACAQAFTENFDDITSLAGNGWVMQNDSAPVGSTNWFQGNPVSAAGPFDSYNGAANAYIGANYNNTGNTGTISNWLMQPNRTLRNGDVLTFYTRKVAPDNYADRLEVRLSTNGASTNAGSGTSVGDFTTLLLSINPNLTLGVYPTTWTQYNITMSGLPAPTSGRMAFRYFVTGAGLSGSNSDYIGIDNAVYTPYVCPAMTISPLSLPDTTWGQNYSQSLGQTGALGAPTFAVTAGALPPGVTLSAAGAISGAPTATGTFNFTVTVSDASGCSGAQAYSISVQQASTTTSLSSACQTTFVENQPFTFMATVSGAPTGTVDFFNGATNVCASVALASGSASCTVNNLAVQGGGTASTLTLTAAYSGDSNHTTSLSPDFNVIVLSAADVVYRGGFEAESVDCPIE